MKRILLVFRWSEENLPSINMFSGMAFPWWMCSLTKLAKKTHKSDEAPIFNSDNVSWCFFCYFSWVVEALGWCVLRIPSGRLTWQWRNKRLKFKDVSPIKHGEIPASHVSFRVSTGRNVFFPHEERPLMSDWTSDSPTPHNQPSPAQYCWVHDFPCFLFGYDMGWFHNYKYTHQNAHDNTFTVDQFSIVSYFYKNKCYQY